MTFLKKLGKKFRPFAEYIGIMRKSNAAAPLKVHEVSQVVRVLMSLPGIADLYDEGDLELAIEDMGWLDSDASKAVRARKKVDPVDQYVKANAPKWLFQEGAKVTTREGKDFKEAFTQADVELALDDRGWLVGGKRMAGELDPISRTVQVNKSRYYWLRDPLARQSVRLWTDYGMGDTAISYRCDDDTVTAKLDKWMKDRRNKKMLSAEGVRRLSNRLLTDGEIFFAFFPDGTVRYFDCLQITDIICDPDDEQTVLAYKRVTNADNSKTYYYQDWCATDEDIAKAATITDPSTGGKIVLQDKVVVYHLAFDAFEKRGTGLLGSCVNWSREHRRFLEARVAITQSLAKFAWKASVKGGQKVIDKIQSQYQSTYVKSGTGGGVEGNPQTAPGGTFAANAGVDMTPMPRATGAGDATQDANLFKLQMSAGTGIMLHYYGDPSTGNLATATAMELPMLKMFGGYQKLWKDAFRDFFAIVLEEDIDAEPAEIIIDLPPILEDDLQQLGTFLTAFTTVFPEAKVDDIIKECLIAMHVEDVDQVLESIKDNREEQAKKEQATGTDTHQKALELVKAKLAGGGPPSNTIDGTESNPVTLASLTEAMRELAKAVKAA